MERGSVMERDAFQNVFDQVGFCGIWCGSCAVGTGALMELADRYRDMCESHGLGHWGAPEYDYEKFLKGLESISGLPVCPGCLKGGGRDNCEIRHCASERHLAGCGACTDPAACRHDALLDHMRSGARAAGLVVVDIPGTHELPKERRQQELASAWWWRALFAEPGTI
jgi:hypothetical protein